MKIYYPAGDWTPDLLNQRQTCYHLSQHGELRSYVKIAFLRDAHAEMLVRCRPRRSIGWYGVALSNCCTLGGGLQTWTRSNCWPAAQWTSRICSHGGVIGCYRTLFDRWKAFDCGRIIRTFWYFCIDNVPHFTEGLVHAYALCKVGATCVRWGLKMDSILDMPHQSRAISTWR